MDEAITMYCHDETCSGYAQPRTVFWNHRDRYGEWRAVYTSNPNCPACNRRMREADPTLTRNEDSVDSTREVTQ